MDIYLFSGIIFLLYVVVILYIERIPFPSTIFCLMWGVGCLMVYFVHLGWFEGVEMHTPYFDKYLIPFTIVTVSSFALVHLLLPSKIKTTHIDKYRLEAILKKYRFILYINAVLGIVKIMLILQMGGINSFWDYRYVALSISSTTTDAGSFIIRIGNYVNLLANMYILLLGFFHGYVHWNKKEMAVDFVLYSIMTMAMGGRLFILYFILYYFGAFIVGRFSLKRESGNKSIFFKGELKTITISMALLLMLVSVIGQLRRFDTSVEEDYASKYLYIVDGLHVADYTMRVFNGVDDLGYGANTFLGNEAKQTKKYRRLVQGTPIQVTVYSLIQPVYLDFGFTGSLVFMSILCFTMEGICVFCFKRLTIMKLLWIFLFIRICYESIIFPSISINIPQFELLIILAIMYKDIFIRWTQSTYEKMVMINEPDRDF